MGRRLGGNLMDGNNIEIAISMLVEECRDLLSVCRDSDSCYELRNDFIDDVASTLKYATEKLLSNRLDALLDGREYEKEI